MAKYSIHQVKTNLSQLLKRVAQGEQVIVTNRDVPVAALVPFNAKTTSKRPKVGTVTSKPVELSDDAFAPLDAADLARDWGI